MCAVRRWAHEYVAHFLPPSLNLSDWHIKLQAWPHASALAHDIHLPSSHLLPPLTLQVYSQGQQQGMSAGEHASNADSQRLQQQSLRQ